MIVDRELICRGCLGAILGDCAECRVYAGERVACNGCGRRMDADDLDKDGLCADCAVSEEVCDE